MMRQRGTLYGSATKAIAAGLTVFILLIGAAIAPQSVLAEAFNLQSVKDQVVRDYKGVKHMETAELAETLEGKGETLLFDVREESEFNVSRIPGAIRISPSSWGWTFLREHGDKVKGKKVVFYCSVGVRSSIMAARVQKGLLERGAAEVMNLNGGIFAWHNEKRGLVNAKGDTSYVHPYDSHWGKLIDRKDLARTGLPN